MNGKLFLQQMGLSSQRFVPMSKPAVNSSHGVGELEIEKDYLSLQADIKAVLYMDERGIHVAE